jgi:hypothetical protein
VCQALTRTNYDTIHVRLHATCCETLIKQHKPDRNLAAPAPAALSCTLCPSLGLQLSLETVCRCPSVASSGTFILGSFGRLPSGLRLKKIVRVTAHSRGRRCRCISRSPGPLRTTDQHTPPDKGLPGLQPGTDSNYICALLVCGSTKSASEPVRSVSKKKGSTGSSVFTNRVTSCTLNFGGNTIQPSSRLRRAGLTSPPGGLKVSNP